MADWLLAVGDPAPTLAPSRELAEATGRRLTARLDGPWDLQFSWSGEAAPWAADHEARSIVPLASDVHVRRDGELYQRFRTGIRSENCDADSYAVQHTAMDYRWMLDRRQIGTAGRVFSTATSQATIAITLIDESEALSGGAWGVDLGTNSGTTTNRTLTLDPGQPIGEAIASQGRLDLGYDWEVVPDSTGDLKLNVWHRTGGSLGRGADNGVVLDYGGLITSFTDLTDPKDFANSVLVTGDMNTSPVASVAAGIGTDPRGRWERSFGFPGIKEQATLDARGPYVRDQTSVLRPQYVVELTAGYWQGKSHIWLGDVVKLVIQVGDLNVIANHRVVEVPIVIGDDGDETVFLGLLSVA